MKGGAHIWNEGQGATDPAGDDPVFIVRLQVYFGVQSGFLWNHVSPACDCWTQTSWQVMQRDRDTGASGNFGKPRVVIYCAKRNMSKSVAVLPQVWKIHC